MKKAQDLGINTIILAAIGVLVLIILIAVFAGNMGKQNKNIRSATNGAQSVINTIGASGVTPSKLTQDISNKGKSVDDCNNVLVDDGLSTLKCVNSTNEPSCWNSTVSAGKGHYFFVCKR